MKQTPGTSHLIQNQQPISGDALNILLTCLNYGIESRVKEWLAAVPDAEYGRVIELAQRHHIASLLDQRLQHLNISLPHELKAALKQERQKNTLQTLRLYQELNRLLNLFQKLDIAVIVLKGAYLAEAVYEQIGLRTMRDIDLMLHKKDLPRVERELMALGYEPGETHRVVTQDIHHFIYHLPEKRFKVEIHWTIVDENFPLRIDVEGLWSRSQPVTLAQAAARVLSPADLLLHLCLHTVIHAYEMQKGYEMRLRMLCDIGEVLRRFDSELDWQELAVRAQEWGATRALYLVLRLAQDLLDTPLPADWLEALRPGHFNEGHLKLAREQILSGEAQPQTSLEESNHLARLSAHTGWAEKLALIKDRLLPARETLALKVPARADSWCIYLYYPVRWAELLIHYGVPAWNLARGDPQTRAIAERANRIMELRDWLMSG